jgi:orotidine-5'-phosphate decarboxylase
MKSLFESRFGVIVACDVSSIEHLQGLVEKTSSVEGIVGYKVGCMLGLTYGLPRISEIFQESTDLPIIYDHQKAGTDIPQLGEGFAQTCKDGGMKGVIIFPQSGPASEEAFIDALLERDMIPIVGGEMTHPKYLSTDGGYIRGDAPQEMYRLAAEKKVEYYVVPGNKPDQIKKYLGLLSPIIGHPKFCMPGIGRQGGQIRSAFGYLKDVSAYAIVGSAIYKKDDMKSAAEIFAREALEFV